MRSLRDRCAIVGVGNTAYTRGTTASTLELQLAAATAALDDAGLRPADVDAVMPNDVSERIVEEFILNLGLSDLAFSSTVRTGGASVISSIQSACMAVATGVANCVLVVAGRRGFSEQRVSTSQTRFSAVQNSVNEFERPYGSLVAAQRYAQSAQRHMHEYGTTSEHFGHIAVAGRRHANLNPQAYMYGRPMTLDDHQQSRLVTTPFHLLDCSLETDGAGAVVIVSAERAMDLPRPSVLVSGIGEGHGYPPTSITQKPDITFVEGLHAAGKRAYTMAGIGPQDIDCAQLYDGFTWFVLASLEALGFCARGEGGPFVTGGRIELGGELPVNTHGGLLSEAHVSGINHVIEAVRQLRHTVEAARQVAECATALVTNEGVYHEGSAMILRRATA